MTENWSMVRGQYCWKWQLRTAVDSKTWQIWQYDWQTKTTKNTISIRGSWQTFGDSSQFSWLSERKDGEGIELIFIFVSCHNWYLCLVTAAPPPGGEQGDARGRRCCRQLGPGTFRVKNRSNFLTLPKCWQLCSEAEGWCGSRGKGGRKSWSGGW